MLEKSNAYQHLYNLFNEHGFHLYLVGGTVRDILLNIPLTDMDVVTDATPEEMKTFIDADFTFSKMGSVKYDFENTKFDITTLRKEKHYKDYRHPAEVRFVKSLKVDHLRRDFTVNAMYMDHHYKLIDYEKGIVDLNNRTLKMVGNPTKRLKEDPLRILRAIRFSLVYGFSYDNKLEKAMNKTNIYLDKISKDKIKMELKKFKDVNKEEIEKEFMKFSIKHLLDVIE